MIKYIPLNRKYILKIALGTTLLVIFIDFVFLNLGVNGLLNWRFHLITALYCFSITTVNLAFFNVLDFKLNKNLDENKRILLGLIGSVLVTLPIIFICRFIHLGLISSSSTPIDFIKNEKLEYYLFPLLIAIVTTLFLHLVFLIKGFKTIKFDSLVSHYHNNLDLLEDKGLEQTEQCSNQLIKLFSKEKYHRNPELNLVMLSRKLGLSTRETSLLIMKIYNKSFSECINDFRLEDVLKMFNNQKHQQYTIMALATEAGFSSKSTFYRYFKKKIGLSPKDYLLQNSLPKPNK